MREIRLSSQRVVSFMKFRVYVAIVAEHTSGHNFTVHSGGGGQAVERTSNCDHTVRRRRAQGMLFMKFL